MIDQGEMVRSEAVEPKKSALAMATDNDVAFGLSTAIEKVRRNVEAPIRLGSSTFGNWGFTDKARIAFLFTANLEGAYPSGLYRENGEELGRVESNRMQTLALKVMKGYGFDENNSRPAEYTAFGHIKTKNGVVDGPEGKSEELILYQSKTIEGLVFRRHRTYDTTTGKTISVGWSVLDRAPSFRINLRKKV